VTELHTDRLTLARSALAPRFQHAIEAAAALQTNETRPEWVAHPDHRVLTLPDGTRFIPDMEDAKAGTLGMISGGLALLFGLALAVISFDSEQAEPWMRVVSPALVAVGGYLVMHGRRRNRIARAAPRTTGAYLFDDVLLHVGEMGSRTFPVARIRGFTRRSRGQSQTYKLFIRYVEDSGQGAEVDLFVPDATATLNEWLETRQEA
jgi:hypothetical protein